MKIHERDAFRLPSTRWWCWCRSRGPGLWPQIRPIPEQEPVPVPEAAVRSRTAGLREKPDPPLVDQHAGRTGRRAPSVLLLFLFLSRSSLVTFSSDSPNITMLLIHSCVRRRRSRRVDLQDVVTRGAEYKVLYCLTGADTSLSRCRTSLPVFCSHSDLSQNMSGVNVRKRLTAVSGLLR